MKKLTLIMVDTFWCLVFKCQNIAIKDICVSLVMLSFYIQTIK